MPLIDVEYKKAIFTISGIVRYPVENTIAFGGVATGNIKANEQATVADIMRYSGCICVARP